MSHCHPSQSLARLFIAIPLPTELIRTGHELTNAAHHPVQMTLEDCLAELRAIGRPVRAVTEHSLHVTLKFLGETDRDLVPEIVDRISDVASGMREFHWQVRGLGAFPGIERPAIVWAGLEPAASCSSLAQALEDALESLGIEPEQRPYRAHLTLARVKGRPPRELSNWIRSHQGTLFAAGKATSIELIQSELRREGPRYRTIASVPLSSEH